MYLRRYLTDTAFLPTSPRSGPDGATAPCASSRTGVVQVDRTTSSRGSTRALEFLHAQASSARLYSPADALISTGSTLGQPWPCALLLWPARPPKCFSLFTFALTLLYLLVYSLARLVLYPSSTVSPACSKGSVALLTLLIHCLTRVLESPSASSTCFFAPALPLSLFRLS